MGWLWWNNSSEPTSGSDPLRDLDPSLREFLHKESPVKYQPVAAEKPPPPPSLADAASQTSDADSSKPKVPKESLFQDGRYAHIWKDYRPQVELEEEAKSDQEKLSDILDGYKARKAAIGRIAVENCIFEQEAIDDCFAKGSWLDRMSLCRNENRRFDRCFVMQSRFLKALGYLSTYDRPASVDEDIQMHADTLYHRMLDQEKAIEAAKAAGEPVPTFAPLITSRNPATANNDPNASFRAQVAASATEAASSQEAAAAAPPTEKSLIPSFTKELPPLPPEVEARLSPSGVQAMRKRVKGLNPMERDIEIQSMLSEVEDASNTGNQISQLRDEARQRRKERGEGRGEWGDWLVKNFGFEVNNGKIPRNTNTKTTSTKPEGSST